jgi:hypothetical protein
LIRIIEVQQQPTETTVLFTEVQLILGQQIRATTIVFLEMIHTKLKVVTTVRIHVLLQDQAIPLGHIHLDHQEVQADHRLEELAQEEINKSFEFLHYEKNTFILGDFYCLFFKCTNVIIQ